MDQLIKFKKKFLVIGNMNALAYKEIFPLFKDNKVRFGPSIKSGDREFGIPRDMETRTPSLRIDDEGNKFIREQGLSFLFQILNL